ncbi:rho guanine nucleotide exchange factor 1 isoform X1 [Xenopus laevis]|uniref:Rho Guanine nucleotide exchange factor 1 isoform X1 n=1 Tax=Xenopus laevis TaxID=8355 RepID=A0A8J0TF55_XENLA|nr:rho guanine nucleotide exchange factor 1 isoform X1 [Xenopus laevis]XP_018083586.1 rho guanine nucleotide exchange factor 1 isoform X1 [Xenopus laevis]
MDSDDGHFGGFHSKGSTSIIGAEDEDFENDIEPNMVDESSYFRSIAIVKDHPAYIMVFLQHVVLQFDPSPLLCFLHAEMLKNLSTKELKKVFLEFHYSFLMKGAVLHVNVPSSISFELDRTRPELIPEETQRKFVKEIQSYQVEAISHQLEDFRAKRVLGMTPGELELNELESYRTNDRSILEAKEKQLAEQLLARLDEMHLTLAPDEDKSSSIFCAIVAYMKHLGVKTKAADSKKSKGIFFRKKVSTNKKDEPLKTKKPFSILDPMRWNRNDSHYVESRPAKVEPEAEKPTQERRISNAQKTFDRSDSSAAKSKNSEGPDSGVSVNIIPPPNEPIESDPAITDGMLFNDVSEVPKGSPTTEHCPADHQMEESAENERRKKRLSGKLGRSESLRVYERKRSQRGSAKAKQTRSRSDVDLEAAARANDLQGTTGKFGPKSGNYTPEPGGSSEGPPSFLLPQSEETEPRVQEAEIEPPNWRELVPPEILLRLKKSEIKRQEVINELFFTEHAHVRMLRVLHDVFYIPMQSGWIPTLELENIFPSLDDLIEAHAVFLDTLKHLRLENNSVIQEIGTILLNRFDGTEGNWFQKISSRFCSRQPFALEQLKVKQKRDPRFTQFIQEAESSPHCRRLQLKDIIPFEMQRLTKYPLLLQNIANLTEEEEEKQRVQRAAECCRQILNHVNQEVREMENKMKLTDYQKRLDVSNLRQTNDPLLNEFKNIDISKKNLIHEGSLSWRVSKDKAVDVHVLLLDDLLMLLLKQDERLVLKCQSRTIIPAPDGKLMLSPIIKLNMAMVREVATDKNAFFVIFNWEDRAQFYELVAPTPAEKKNWFLLISKTTGLLEPPPSSKQRHRSITPGTMPQSPSDFADQLLSSSENGNSLKESVSKDEKEESVEDASESLEEKDFVGLTEYLLASNIDLNQEAASGGNVANEALEEVTVLKRLLVRNIRLSVDADLLSTLETWSAGEEAASEKTTEQGKASNGGGEAELSVVEAEVECTVQGENGRKLSPTDGAESLCAPIVLSKEQSEEVKRHILSLEQRIHQLKLIEEDYNNLHRTITKITVPRSSFT